MRKRKGLIETLANGSVNPVIPARMDLIPPRALLRIGETLDHGFKYEKKKPGNWRGVPAAEHLNHALHHIAQFQAGDRFEDHVGHALTRMMMWGELVLEAREHLPTSPNGFGGQAGPHPVRPGPF